MRQLFVFIARVIVGALLIVGISSAIRSSESYKQKQMLAGILLSRLENLTEEPKVNVQYIEVKGRKGRVMLFTTMHKDSVQSLLGKPDEVRMRTSYKGSVEEDWGYKINNK
ncbi:MAG: hypothetical protein ACRC6V_18355 [Bacteroidales bacterium]